MKATGIVRRIDDLGRVVIPREIRRTMVLRDGDPLEIFLDDNGVIFKKYHVEASYQEAINSIIKEMNDDMDLKSREAIVLLQKARNILSKESNEYAVELGEEPKPIKY